MGVRKKTLRSGQTVYVLVRSVRDGKRVRQVFIAHLGQHATVEAALRAFEHEARNARQRAAEAEAAIAGTGTWPLAEENPKTLRRWARQWRAEARDLEVKIRKIRRWQKSSS